MYRGSFLVILISFLLGINIYGWRSSGVNHVLIFELNPRDHLSHSQTLEVRVRDAARRVTIWMTSLFQLLVACFHVSADYFPCFSWLVSLFQLAGFLGCTWICGVVFYLLGGFVIPISVFSYPFSLVCFMLVFLFNPLPICYKKARWWLLRFLVSTWRAGGSSGFW